ncbi:MAG: Gfo/Idh/MocA family oxidoreductase [Bacteroidales bacterium]|nr:Gfo/Idh/MocA family oxidoreductase [Bacteroidales bacterium]
MGDIVSIKVAVLGGGYYGKNCIRHILSCNSAELVGFYEEDEDVASSVQSLFNVERFTELNVLIEIVDAVIIALPLEKRYKIAALSLKKGKHVLVESPVSFKSSEVEHLVSLANEAQVVHCVSICGIIAMAEEYLKENPQLRDEKNIFIECKRYIDEGENIFEVLVADIHILMMVINSGIKKIRKSIVGKNIVVRFEFENEMSAHYLVVERSASPNCADIIVYTSSCIIDLTKKRCVTVMAKKDIETFFSSISENVYYYPFFEKELASVNIASKILI